MDWPAIPGRESYLVILTPTATLPAAAAGQTLTAAPVRQATSTPAVVWQVPEAGPAGGGPLEAFGRDPLANSLAVLALVGGQGGGGWRVERCAEGGDGVGEGSGRVGGGGGGECVGGGGARVGGRGPQGGRDGSAGTAGRGQ